MLRRVLLSLLLLLLTSCKFAEDRRAKEAAQGGAAHPSAKISIRGSEAMRPLAVRLGAAYKDAAVSVDGGGTTAGLAALLSGGADVAMASRSATPEERARGQLVETPVAFDTIAVYVNEMNPVHELSVDQLGAILTGRTRAWRDLGGPNAPIVVYGEGAARGVTTYLDMTDVEPKPQRDFADARGVLAAVADDPAGIGYAGLVSAARTRPLWIRRADGASVAPTDAAIHDRSYPLSGRLFFYTLANAPQHVRQFVDWCGSPAAKKAIAEAGYVK